MPSTLFGYHLALHEVLVLLLLVVGAGLVVLWGMRKRWQNRQKALEQQHADNLDECERECFQALYGHLQSSVAHEFVKGLDYISKKSVQTLEGLGEGQSALRDKQHRIVATSQELAQHAANILDLYRSEREKSRKELLSMRRLVEGVLLELFPYAQSKGVTLMPQLDDVEPTILHKDDTSLVLRNVIHNAIKFSDRGGVVEIVLSLETGEREEAGQAIHVDVKDTGKGIREEDQGKIFELKKRGDGLVEPGSGLGLYLARKAARRQGGDVILVISVVSQGSVFRIIFPYTGFEE
jgi:signal transduction histidine kinase